VKEKEAINSQEYASQDLKKSLGIFDELGEFGDVLIEEQLIEEGLPSNAISQGIVTREEVVMKIIEMQ
jgi:hypothetical protein